MQYLYNKETDYIAALRELNYTDDKIMDIINNSVSILKIRYVDPDFPTLYISEKGNWIDLKCIEDYNFKTGESGFINLGVAMKLPNGYEAHLVPRSGTFNKYGLIQTNGVGIIDNSYSGNNDIWQMPVYATTDTYIKKGERLCQFRLFPTMEEIFKGQPHIMPNWFASFGSGKLSILEVSKLDEIDRGGFGSTGR